MLLPQLHPPRMRAFCGGPGSAVPLPAGSALSGAIAMVPKGNPSELATRLANILAEAREVLGPRILCHTLFLEADRLRRRLDDQALRHQDGDPE